MTTPQPLLDDLVEKIKDRLSEGPLSEIDFRRFELAAEKLRKKAPEMAYSALGILACIRMDETTCRKFHERSIRLAPLASVVHHNFGVSLMRLGYLSEAVALAQKAISLEPMNKRSAGLLLDATYRLGDAALLDWALAHWRSIAAGERHPVEDYVLEDEGDAARVDEALAEVKTHGTVPWKEFCKEFTA